MDILKTAAQTLSSVHNQGMLHRDVSPENLFVTREGQIKLIDFGATRFFVGERSRSLSVILKPGFAPPEQYSSKGSQGPWTDLYALCATFYAVVTSSHPPDAPDRLAGIPLEPLTSYEVSPLVAQAVELGLSLDYRKRPQSMDAFLSLLSPVSTPEAGEIASAMGTPYLQRVSEVGAGDRWILPKNMVMTIGRSASRCNIVLDFPNVSRVHCELRYDDKHGVFYLTDHSTNGTLLDSGRMERGKAYCLSPGSRFYILTREGAMEVGLL